MGWFSNASADRPWVRRGPRASAVFGVLAWGLPMFFLQFALQAWRDEPIVIRRVVIGLLVWPLGGAGWGLWMWAWARRSCRRRGDHAWLLEK